MKVSKLIKSRREQLVWDDIYMPSRVGLSWSEYCDIEACEDELKEVTPFMYVRRIAEAIAVPVHNCSASKRAAMLPTIGAKKSISLTRARGWASR